MSQMTTTTREFPIPPSGGLIPPTFAQHPHPEGKGGREGKGREGEREGERRMEGKGPPRVGWHPMFQILKNTLTTVWKIRKPSRQKGVENDASARSPNLTSKVYCFIHRANLPWNTCANLCANLEQFRLSRFSKRSAIEVEFPSVCLSVTRVSRE